MSFSTHPPATAAAAEKSSKQQSRPKTPPDLSRYYTPSEVQLHNSQTDLWMSWLGNVYDLTTLVEEESGGFWFL